MAKIIMTIEDLPGNRVSVKVDPTFEEMMKMDISGSTLTSAHGYALNAINSIRRASASKENTSNIIIPTLGRY